MALSMTRVTILFRSTSERFVTHTSTGGYRVQATGSRLTGQLVQSHSPTGAVGQVGRQHGTAFTGANVAGSLTAVMTTIQRLGASPVTAVGLCEGFLSTTDHLSTLMASVTLLFDDLFTLQAGSCVTLVCTEMAATVEQSLTDLVTLDHR